MIDYDDDGPEYPKKDLDNKTVMNHNTGWVRMMDGDTRTMSCEITVSGDNVNIRAEHCYEEEITDYTFTKDQLRKLLGL